MSDTNGLTVAERNLIIVTAKTRRDFDLVARMLEYKNAEDAEQAFERATAKLQGEVYASPNEKLLASRAIAERLGVHKTWVDRRLKPYEHMAVYRIGGSNKKLHRYFPEHFVVILEKLKKTSFSPPGPGWATERSIGIALNASNSWVKLHISPYRHLGVRGRADNGHSRVFYPPHVIEVLKLLREAYDSYPVAGDYLTISQIRNRVKKSHAWVKDNILILGFKPEYRKDGHGKIVAHFPPQVIPLLEEIAAKYPDADDWMTAHTIATTLKIARRTVKRWVAKFEFPGELRTVPGTGRAYWHFPPWVFAELKRLAEAKQNRLEN